MVEKSSVLENLLLKVAKKWIAGRTLNDALESAQWAYKNKRHAIINKLGEYHKTEPPIAETLKEYQKIVTSFKKWQIRGAISIKPTQLGLSISKGKCHSNFIKIIHKAAKAHVFVWMDMESSEHTDDTIEIYHDLFSRYERLGIALQANLKRTNYDLTDLIEHGAKIRLVKGAYRENSKISYKTRTDVDKNYSTLMKKLFQKGNEFGIATHDSKLIKKAEKLSKINQKKFEFQLLKGVREDLKPQLIKKGFIVSDYIPYGTNWLPYSIRRLRERKRNILLLGSSLFQSHRV